MSLAQQMRVTSIQVQVVDFGDITGSFTAFGTPMPAPIRILKIQNTTDADLYISFDGITANDVVVASSGMVLDITTNKSIDQGMYIAQETIFYLASTGGSPTSGSVYLSAYYTVNN